MEADDLGVRPFRCEAALQEIPEQPVVAIHFLVHVQTVREEASLLEISQ